MGDAMTDPRSVQTGDRWIVTEQGAYDLICAETCACDPKLAGLLLQCPDCGTVYGSLRQSGPWTSGSRKRD